MINKYMNHILINRKSELFKNAEQAITDAWSFPHGVRLIGRFEGPSSTEKQAGSNQVLR